jgi:DNA-binding CsgD family transcriptional regulator
VGRDGELGLAASLVAAVTAGRGAVLLVEGEPGIGKSAFLAAVCAAAADQGCAIFRGTGDELGQAFPLRPLVVALAVEEMSADPRRAEVARLLQGEQGGSGGRSDAVVAAAEQLIAVVDDACAHAPAVLVVDDLHWADPATVSVWQRLARSASQRALLVAGAARPLGGRPDLAALRRTAGRALVRLGPLPAPAVDELVAAMAGGPPGPRLAKLAEGAAGNPLYLTELVAALDRGGQLTVSDGVVEAATGPAPQTLREVIWDRLRFLPDQVRELLRAAALLGIEFDVGELAVVSRRPAIDLLPDLRAARAAGVLAETQGALAFRHPLLRAALYDEPPAAVRAGWHRDAARALHDAGASAERVARQLLPAFERDAPLDDWTVDWLVSASPALAEGGSEVAVRLLRPAVRQLTVADPRRQVLAHRLASALTYQAEYEQVDQLISDTLPHVRDSDVMVGLFNTLALAWGGPRRGHELDESLVSLNRVLAEVPWLTPTARRRLTVIAARMRHSLGEMADAEAILRPSLAEARGAGDLWALSWACNSLGVIYSRRGEPAAAIELIDEALSAIDSVSALADIRLLLLLNRAESEMDLDRLGAARSTLAEAKRQAERSGNLHRLAHAQCSLCELLFAAGEWDDALAEAVLTEGVDDSLDQCIMHSVAAIVAFHRGDARLGQRRHAISQRFRGQVGVCDLGAPVLAGALDREVAGDPPGALAVLAAALADPSAEQPEAELWLADTVRLALELADRDIASATTALAEKLAEPQQTVRWPAIVTHCRGLLDGDIRLLNDAADGYLAAGRPLPRAQALEAAGALHAERGDLAGARKALAAAHDGYAALGAKWDITRVRARLHRHGFRAPRTRARPATGWAALTRTEAKIAYLLAEGLSNPQIAERLVISSRTVEAHVSRILAKLEVRSRVDVARVAADSEQSRATP